jgi:hypothetical protein
LEDEPIGFCHVNKSDIGKSPRALSEGGRKKVGFTARFQTGRVGPFFSQPKILRTKLGDISLDGKEGGADSGPKRVEPGEVLDSGPGGLVFPVVPSQMIGGSSPKQNLPLTSSDIHYKGGRTKKMMKRAHTYLPGNKFYKY